LFEQQWVPTETLLRIEVHRTDLPAPKPPATTANPHVTKEWIPAAFQHNEPSGYADDWQRCKQSQSGEDQFEGSFTPIEAISPRGDRDFDERVFSLPRDGGFKSGALGGWWQRYEPASQQHRKLTKGNYQCPWYGTYNQEGIGVLIQRHLTNGPFHIGQITFFKRHRSDDLNGPPRIQGGVLN
jgi:hypothetical protein